MALDLTQAQVEAEEPLIDLTATQLVGPAPLSKEKLEERSVKYALALGEQSPDLDKVSSLVSSPGGEDILRDTATRIDAEERRKAAEALLASTEPVPLPDLEGAVEASRRPVSRQIALEKRFAERVFNSSLSSTDNPDEVNAGVQKEVSQQMYDFLVDSTTRHEAFKKILEDKQAQNEQRGWGEFLSRSALQLIPGYTETSQSSESLGENIEGINRYIPGANKQEQYAYLDTLPVEEAVALVKKVVSEMDSVQADTWLQGLVEGYSDSEAGLDNVFFGLDIAGITPVKTIGRLAKGVKIGKGGARIKSAVDATKNYVARKEALNNVPTDAERLKEGWKIVTDTGAPTDKERLADGWEVGELAEAAPTVNRLVRTAVAARQPNAKVDNILAGIGKMDEASQVKALSLARKLLGDKAGGTVEEGVKLIAARLPSLFDPEQFTIELSKGHTVRAGDLLEVMQRNSDLFARAFSQVLNVQRIPTAVEREALALAEQQLKLEARTRGLEKAFVGLVEKFESKTSGLNIAYVEAKLGRKDGTLFESADVAKNFADKRYGLLEGTYSVTQEGDRYAIRIRKDVDETSEFVRQAIVKTDFTNQERNKILGIVPVPKSVSGAKETLSAFQSAQRETMTSAQTALAAYMRAMVEPIQALSKREKQALEKIMQINRDTYRVPGDPNTRGMFYNSIAELEEAYVQHIGRLPTQEEATAYATFIQQSDADYIFRSVSEMKAKARMGVERMQVKFGTKTADFEGKEVEKLPFGTRYDATVYLAIDKGKMHRLNEPGLSETLGKAIKEKEWKIVQLFNPEDAAVREQLGVSGPVNFVVVPSLKKGALRFDEQLPYRPGFHVKYKDEYFVKQGRVTRDSTGRLIYSGDTAALGSSNAVKAAEEAKLWERARLAVKNKDDAALDQIIKDGLPLSKKEIKQAFKERFSLETPFSVTKKGESAADPLVKTANGRSLKDEIGEFEDFSNSPYNLSKQAANEYTGHKDGPLHSIKNIGTEENPIYRMEEARTVDVMQTQVEAMNRLIRDRHFEDYKISSAESFVGEFKDLLTMDGKNPIDARELMRNPIYYAKHAKIREGVMDKRAFAAKNAQAAMNNLLYHKTMLGTSMAHLRGKLLSEAYKRSGEKYIEAVDNFSASLQTDLFSKARAIAFHSKLGLFNPVQIFLQANTLTAISAIAPKYAASSIPMSYWMRQLDLVTGDDAMIKAMAKRATKIVPGWSEAHFIEARKLLNKTGFDIVGKEASYRNDLADEKIFKGAGSKFLDWGATFFNGSERLVRIAAWNTAYREYADMFPGLVGKMNADDVKTILSRANDLSMNMTRAGHARWQEGSASVMTQFWGYSMRMFDAMTGLRLTPAEKARLVLMNSMMYGVPIAGAAMLPVYPWDKELRQYLIEGGYAPNEGIADVIVNGLVASTISAVTAAYGDEEIQLDIGGRYGPGAIQVLWNLMEMKQGEDGLDKLLDVIGGASGTIIGQMLSDAYPVIADIGEMARTREPNFNILKADVLNAMKNISTFNNMERLWIAANLGIRETRDHGVVDPDYNLDEAIFNSITGIDNQKISDSFLMMRSTKQEKEFNGKINKEVRKWLNLWRRAVSSGDTDAAEEYKKKATVWMDAGNLTSEQRSRIIGDVWKDKDMLKSSKDAFIKAPNSKDEELRRQIQLEGK